MSDNPNSSFFIITSKTFEIEHSEFEETEYQDVDCGHVSNNKSDSYILDSVLAHFVDEELQEYGDRLLFSVSDLDGRNPQEIKTVVLDDWIMSG